MAEKACSGKGYNETIEIVNSMAHTRATNNDVEGHVPENGGTDKT
jgi:hypothetical protein